MNAFRIEKLAIELDQVLANSSLIDAFTTSSNDVFFVFDSLCVRITFYQGKAYFQFPDVDSLPKRNRLPVFRNAKGQKVERVIPHPYDRVFEVSLDQGNLAFFLYGKFAVLGWFDSAGNWEECFPVKAKCPKEIGPSNRVLKDYLVEYDNESSIIKNLPFLTTADASYLTSKRFINVNNEVRQQMVEEVRKKQLAHNRFNLVRKERTAEVVPSTAEAENLEGDLTFLEAIGQQSRYALSKGQFYDLKQSQITSLNKAIKGLEKKLESAEKRIEVLEQGGGNREKGDLIMAYMHAIAPGVEEVDLPRFDGTGTVKIKLKHQLTPQANAARFYKKAKNEARELEFARLSARKLEKELDEKKDGLKKLSSLEDIKQLRRGAPAPKKEGQRLPYRSVVVDGFEVRIGKGAHDNDELLSRYSHKNDTWLHAKDVSGSHVLIRNTSNEVIPAVVLEKVASLAAYYSKAKTESLAAVIHTSRKYVRKWKGAPPGKVRVERESVLLVEPKDIESYL